MILLEEHKPLVTDWMIATGALAGIPLAIWGIITLFIRDKNKERHLKAVEDIALSQGSLIAKMEEQVEQLASQTAQFQYQSFLMVESNKLIERQLEIQTSVFEHTKEANRKKQEIEDQKRMESIRPFFTISGSGAGTHGFYFLLYNQGHDAFDIKIHPVDFQFIEPINIVDNTNIESKKELSLSSSINPLTTTFTNNQVPFEANIQYKDQDDNLYEQNIKREKTGKYKISSPILKNKFD
jgi:hypothetical protein